MESIISIDNLNLTNELKNTLLSNQIYTVYDFFEKGISVFREYFWLTCEDWKSIINVFVSFFPEKRCNNPVIASIANKYHKKHNPLVDALLVNFFDEKYVVHVKKKSKWLFDDYIYKAIFNGIVFYSYDEAKKFAELICEKNKSKLIEREIKSAQNNIYVIKAFLREKEKCILYCDTVADNEKIIKVINESTNECLVKPLRANKLLREMVEKINCIYDYDIAKIVIADFDGENLCILDSDTELYEEIDNDSSDKVFVDVKKYRLELSKNIDNESTEYFNWGKNDALCEAAFWSIKFIKNKLLTYADMIEEYKEDAGITEEDVSYANGYIEGLNIALKTQISCIPELLEVQIALIDLWGLISQSEHNPEWVNNSVTKGNCTMHFRLFDSLDDLKKTDNEFYGYFVLCNDNLSRDDENELFNLKIKFYEDYKENLFNLNIKNNWLKKIKKEIFLLDNTDSTFK